MSLWSAFQTYSRVYPQPPKPPQNPVWVIAHRGASQEAPENTIAAFELAIQQGADMIELDVRLSRDQELVVFHDRSLKRITGQKGWVKHYTLAELRQLDAGAWMAPHFKGEKIPFLAEVLERCCQRIMLNIEIKGDAVDQAEPLLEKKLLQLLRHYQMREQVLISSFLPLPLKRLKALDPGVSTALLYGTSVASSLRPRLPSDGLEAFDCLLDVRADALNLQAALVTEQVAERCRAVGIRLFPFTVDSPMRQKKLLYLGVQGIITNRPLSLRQLLHQQL